MGCDIHLTVEAFRDGSWRCVPNDCGDWYDNRNYDVFAILADVRNGSGFAGVSTGEGFAPIAPRRGIPADACVEYLRSVCGVDAYEMADDAMNAEFARNNCVGALAHTYAAVRGVGVRHDAHLRQAGMGE